MIKYWLIILSAALSCNFNSTEDCKASCATIPWNAFTKNRITKEKIEDKIKEGGFDFNDIRIEEDSLSYYLSSLIPSSDALYNIRMFCLIKCSGKKDELFFDHSGLIEYNGTCYQKDDRLLLFFLTRIPFENKSEGWPVWLK